MPTNPRPIDSMALLAKLEPEEALSQEQWLKHIVSDFTGVMATLTMQGNRHSTKIFHDYMMSYVIDELQDRGVDVGKMVER